MLTASHDRVDDSIARIGRSGARLERSLDALRRSRYRLQPIAGGATPSVSDLASRSIVVIDRVRSIPRHVTTPILAVTGWTEKDVHPVECGFTAFMQKPVDLDRLAAELLRLARAGAPVSARVAS